MRTSSPTNVSPALRRFVADLQNSPLVDIDEELRLIREAKAGCEKAKTALTKSHGRIAVRIARVYAKRYSMPFEDLLSEGMVGLLISIRKFEFDRNSRFATYSFWWIESGIKRFCIEQVGPLKVSPNLNIRNIIKEIAKWKKANEHLGPLPLSALMVVAGNAGVDGELVCLVEAILMQPSQSLDQPVGEEGGVTHGDLLEDKEPNPEEHLIANENTNTAKTIVSAGLEVLSPRERDIFVNRRLVDDKKQMTLESLAGRYGISRERVRQLELGAVKKFTRATEAARLQFAPEGRVFS